MMKRYLPAALTLLTAAFFVSACSSTAPSKPAAATTDAKPKTESELVAVPKDKDTDLRLYKADGSVVKGVEAMDKMQSDSGLILWLAGNQFFAVDEVVHAFQKKHPDTSVSVITLPPGLIAKAIKAGGWMHNGKEYRGLPDIYASVSLEHLQDLKKSGLMDTYMTYMHNELQILVAKGNPKKVKGIDDLVRPDIKTSNPNPINEGIMQFYAKKVLQTHGIWDKISAGKECESCQTTPNNWFTKVHHRETPMRIKEGTSDAGIVWKTEVLEAIRDGAQVEGVELPPADSMRNEVSYAIGALTKSKRMDAAKKYLDFLVSSEGQAAYAKFGFVSATADELKMKPIP